jgi:hypothetical protein
MNLNTDRSEIYFDSDHAAFTVKYSAQERAPYPMARGEVSWEKVSWEVTHVRMRDEKICLQ